MALIDYELTLMIILGFCTGGGGDTREDGKHVVAFLHWENGLSYRATPTIPMVGLMLQ